MVVTLGIAELTQDLSAGNLTLTSHAPAAIATPLPLVPLVVACHTNAAIGPKAAAAIPALRTVAGSVDPLLRNACQETIQVIQGK